MVRKPSQHDVDADRTGENKERKGLWSPEEDERLFNQITMRGVSTWSSVAQLAGLRRSGKSCRLRWMNYLRPDLKKGPISKREEMIIISLQQSLGNRWSAIAAKMPGRTDNEIKNYWNSRIRKRLTAAKKAGSTTTNSAEEPSAPPAAGDEKEESTDNAGTAAATLPIPARFPVFACQLLDGSGAAALQSPTTTTTTTQQQNSSSEESKASVGDGGEDAYHCSAAVGGGDSSIMGHDFLAFDELEYQADLLVDLPGVMDAWESELYSASSANSMGSLN